MNTCPSEEQFERYHSHALSPPQIAEFEAHLRECAACAQRDVARKQAQQALIDDLREIGRQPAKSKQCAGSPGRASPGGPESRDPTAQFAEDPSPDAAAECTDVGLPGPVIKDYEILREVYRGGQGIVFQAIQKHTKRKVAVKVLLEGAYASPLAKRRFEREIELVAQLKHANVITVFDSGLTADGRQYCIMDYVHGRRLDQHVREKRLPLEETLALFAIICDAVMYAHQRGIIHRDLKPSNILVDADGSPKILDFGMAKQMTSAAETLASMTGQVFGTLPYLSPEQAGGNPEEVDTRTDIYALGVILYHLLTGKYPYPVEGQLTDVLRHITETPPTPPSRAWAEDSGVTMRSTRQLRPSQCPIDDEVQTIVVKTLAKERERRYQSAAELARDIRHYLAGEPIEAKRDSSWYVLRKTIRRYKIPVAMTAALVVVAVGAAIALSVMYRNQARLLVRVEQERETAIRAQAEAEQARDEADRSREAESEQRVAAEKARDESQRQAAKAGAVSGFLREMLAAPNPESGPTDPELARGIKVVDVLDNAAATLDKALSEQPDVEAALRLTLGITYRELGLFDKAESQLRRAVEINQSRLGEEHFDTIEAVGNLAAVLREKGDYAAAETLARQAYEALRRVSGDDDAGVIAVLNLVAICRMEQGDFAEAEVLMRRAVDSNRKTLGEEHSNTLTAQANLAVLLRRRDKPAEAEELLRGVLTIQKKTLGEDNPHTLTTLCNLAQLLLDQKRLDEAEPYYREVYDGFRRILGDEHPDTLTVMNDYAMLLAKRGKTDEAEPLLRSSLEVSKRVLGEQHPDTLESLTNLASLMSDQGRLAEAEALYREALAKRRASQGNEHPRTLNCMLSLTDLLRERDKLAEAEALAREALEGHLRLRGEDDARTVDAMRVLALVLQSERRYSEAAALFRKILPALEKILGEDHKTTLSTMLSLGEVCYGLGELADAEAIFRQLLEKRRRIHGSDDESTLVVLNHLAIVLKDRAQNEEAATLLQECYEGYRELFGEKHP
ncbi:MAG TPA: tetratricopeptide repeat protein, partial [Phycisphaerae bacterium]|nr:tetratricopeptide repeat protein [Phycisphaerae bacterium]